MQPRPKNQTLIALCSFTKGIGIVRMWSRYTEDGRRVRERLQLKQAMEDVTVIDGLELQDAKKLGRANILSIDHLKVIQIERLEASGLRGEAIDAIKAWRSEDGVEEEEAEPQGLAAIEGLNPTNRKKLEGAGLNTPEKLLAAPEEALKGLKLSKDALAAVIAFRVAQAQPTAKGRETK